MPYKAKKKTADDYSAEYDAAARRITEDLVKKLRAVDRKYGLKDQTYATLRKRRKLAGPKGKLPNPRIRYLKPKASKQGGISIRELKEAAENGEEWAKKAYKSVLASIRRMRREGNPLFDAAATRSAKRVTKIRPVRDRASGEKGEIIGTAPGGFIKVQWHGRSKPTLIKRSEIKRGRYPNVGIRTGNPGPFDIVYGLQAYDYISKKKVGNPKTKHHKTIWAHTAFAMPGGAKEEKARLSRLYFDAGKRVAKEGGFRSSKSAFSILFGPKAKPWRYDKQIGFTRADAEKAFVSGFRAKENPSVRSLSEKFQGRVSGAVRRLKAASSAPSDLARLGKLIFFRVNGKDIRIPGAMVCASASEKIWIAGPEVPMLNQKAKRGGLLDFGKIEKIVYLTAKQHIGNGETFEYDHDFENPLPSLRVDHEGMPIFHGGGYRIKAEGITG